MKILNIMVILIAVEFSVSRILYTAHNRIKKHKSRKLKKTRKLFHATQLDNLAIELNKDLDEITKAYEEIEGEPFGYKTNVKSSHHKDPISEDFIKGLHTINVTLKDTNNLLVRYINHYVLTPKIVKGYDKYLNNHKNNNSHDQNDILAYMVKHIKDIRMRKKEDSFFSSVNRYVEIINHQLLQISKSPNKTQILKKIRVKLANANRLTTFIRKYMFFVTHLNTDYHFVDRDFAKYGERGHEISDRHKIKHKNFVRDNDHVPLTIVISKEDLQQVQGKSMNEKLNMDQKISDEKEDYINKQFEKNKELGDIMEDDIKEHATLFNDKNVDDEDDIKLLAREKEESGISNAPNNTLGFVEPKAKPIQSLNNSDLSTLDIEQSTRVNELLNLENEKSELDNLRNIPTESQDNKVNIDITKDVYKPILNDQNNLQNQQTNGLPIKQEDAYLHHLLGLNHEAEELHVSSQANNNEPSNLELIRQPDIEVVHDHGYVTVINPDDERNIRLSKKSDLDETVMGKENNNIINSYNKLISYNSQNIGDYLKNQNEKVRNYFQPIINDTFHDLNQPIIEPNQIKTNVPYYIDDKPSYGIDPKIGQNMNLHSTVKLDSQATTMSSRAQERYLFSSSKDYWNKKAESAFQNLLSGKFRR